MRLARALSSGLALAGAARWAPPRGPLIVLYHGLGGRDGISERDFSAQLELLSSRRRVVPLREALQSLGEAESQELAAITFDDGYVDFAELAVPALFHSRRRVSHLEPSPPAIAIVVLEP